MSRRGCWFLLFLVTLLDKGLSQSVTTTSDDNMSNVSIATVVPTAAMPQMCIPLNSDHICLPMSGRNSSYRYPQRLPESDGSIFTSNSIQVGFLFLSALNPPIDPDCSDALKHIICLGATPPCNVQTDLLLPICPESCLAYDRIIANGQCQDVLVYAQTLQAESQLSHFQILLNLLFSFDCNNISSYIFYDNPESLLDSNHCTRLFSPEVEEDILKLPNQCVETPSTICDITVGHNGYYIPLLDRNDTDSLRLLENLDPESNCTAIQLNVGCYYLFPPCDPTTGNFFPICYDICEDISDLIGSCFSDVSDTNPLFEIASTFNCSDRATYIPPFVLIDNNTCVNGSGIVKTTTIPEPSFIAVGVIAGATVGAVLFVVLVCVFVLLGVIILYRHRKSGFHNLRVPGYEMTISLRKGSENGSLNDRVYSMQPGDVARPQLTRATKDTSATEDELVLSEADRQIYKKTFSTILVPYALLTVGKEIGQGAFGKVFRGEKIKPGADTNREEVAVKTIKNLSSHEEVEAFFDESFVMKDFKHPNVLGLVGVCFDTPDGIPYILLPYMANGSLKDYLKNKRVHVTDVNTIPEDLNMSILVQMCLDIAQGMQYLASMKFVHRDLAARNCMIDTSLNVKVGDFGLARDIYTSHYYRANRNAKVPVKWMPPETLHDGISNEKTDIWSFGVTCWEVFSLGRTPYPGIQNHDVLKHISDDQRLERPSICPKMLYDMIMFKCWMLKPEERPTFSVLAQQLQEYWEEEHAYM